MLQGKNINALNHFFISAPFFLRVLLLLLVVLALRPLVLPCSFLLGRVQSVLLNFPATSFTFFLVNLLVCLGWNPGPLRLLSTSLPTSHTSDTCDDYFKVLFEASPLHVTQSGFKFAPHSLTFASSVLYFKIRKKNCWINPRKVEHYNLKKKEE